MTAGCNIWVCLAINGPNWTLRTNGALATTVVELSAKFCTSKLAGKVNLARDGVFVSSIWKQNSSVMGCRSEGTI